jgi:hypothetical protein
MFSEPALFMIYHIMAHPIEAERGVTFCLHLIQQALKHIQFETKHIEF